MQLRLTTELPAGAPRLAPRSRMMLLGSCFAEHMGQRMAAAGLAADVNPFGVVYNPESIAAALDALLGGRLPEDIYFAGADGLWHSWLHSGAFSAPERAACREAVEQRFGPAAAALRQTDVLFVTLGTAWVFTLKSGRVVANCHKEPPATFAQRRLGVEEITARWQPLLARLEAACPGLHTVFTISPFRYTKLGLHGNQLTKATLLLAVDELCRGAERRHYFPAYEIVTDELRDYRFYERDMAHPSAVAVDYVWEQLDRWLFTPETRRYIAEREALARDLAHRPLHPGSAGHASFLRGVLRRLEALGNAWPWLDLSEERAELLRRLEGCRAGNDNI